LNHQVRLYLSLDIDTFIHLRDRIRATLGNLRLQGLLRSKSWAVDDMRIHLLKLGRSQRGIRSYISGAVVAQNSKDLRNIALALAWLHCGRVRV
jgi:hypothetical protein